MIDKNLLISFIENIKKDEAKAEIAFQGGEPLLAGIDFYREIWEKTGTDGLSFSVQTNATSIDEKWCELFNKYDVLVGVSIDGTEKDNALRKYPNGENAFTRTEKAIALLKKYNVQHNLVCVVSNGNVNRLGEIFDYFTGELQERYLQFIPCLKTSFSDYSLSVEEYYTYLQTLFDRYFEHILRGDYVSVRYFDELVRVARGNRSSQCGMNGRCERQIVVESDGSVYPCDFYCDAEHLSGNIANDSYKELLFGTLSDEFTKKAVLEKCKKCKYYKLCRGGCKRQRQDRDYCESVYRFLDNNIQKLIYITKLL